MARFCLLLLLLTGCFLLGGYAQKVVIVGAGVSGLSAANHLCKHGICDVTVLEAEDRIGGRLYTDYFKGELVERGAQWIHGKFGNPVYTIISSQNHTVIEDQVNVGSIKLSSGNTPGLDAFVLVSAAEELWDDLNGQLLALEDETTEKNKNARDEARKVWDAKLLSRNITIEKAITDAVFNFTMVQWSLGDGERAHNVSVLSFLYYQYLEGGDVIVPEGYSVLLDILQQGIPKSAIKLGRKVTKINWKKSTSGKVTVEYNEGNEIINRMDADYVIFTASLGVLKSSHRSLFAPNLSKLKSAALDKLRIGTVNKIFMFYKQKFWNEKDFPIGFLLDTDIQKEFKEDGHWYKEIHGVDVYRENILLVWANAYASREALELPNEKVGQKLTILFRKMMANDSIPFPDDMLITRWHKMENFLGSYSYIAFGETKATRQTVMKPLEVNGIPKVCFAGEAMHLERYSTVDGAYRTGVREANRIIKLQSNT